jgi:t-SNARE complex subunit (syntaxin)
VNSFQNTRRSTLSVKNAADHVEDANVDVYEAIEYQKKARKKQCLIILIVVVLLIVVLFATGILKPK